MEKCVCGEEAKTSYVCSKHNVHMCQACMKCRDPEIYCKFRSSCVIWYMQKHDTENLANIE